MELTLEVFIFIPFIFLSLYIISKIADHFDVYYERTVLVMVAAVVLLGFVHKYNHLRRVNKNPPKGEPYRMERADFHLSFREDAGVTVEHILTLRKNKGASGSNPPVIRYAFQESGAIKDPQVRVNGSLLSRSTAESRGRYRLRLAEGKNEFMIHPPSSKERELELRLSYSVKNPLRLDESGCLTYYNTFLADREGFSFNTNVKGEIRLFLPQKILLGYGAHAENLYLTAKQEGEETILFSFENKLPYDKKPFARGHDCIRRYDYADREGEYTKDFSVAARIDLLSPDFSEPEAVRALQKGSLSVARLRTLQEETNSNFSDCRFLYGCFITTLLGEHLLFFAVTLPYIHSYYKRKQEEFFERWADWIKEGEE